MRALTKSRKAKQSKPEDFKNLFDELQLVIRGEKKKKGAKGAVIASAEQKS